jgi:hypothetical protein
MDQTNGFSILLFTLLSLFSNPCWAVTFEQSARTNSEIGPEKTDIATDPSARSGTDFSISSPPQTPRTQKKESPNFSRKSEGSALRGLSRVSAAIEKFGRGSWSAVANCTGSFTDKSKRIFQPTLHMFDKKSSSLGSDQQSSRTGLEDFEQIKREVDALIKNFIEGQPKKWIEGVCPQFAFNQNNFLALKPSLGLATLSQSSFSAQDPEKAASEKCLSLLSFERRDKTVLDWLAKTPIKKLEELKQHVRLTHPSWKFLFESQVKASYLKHARLAILKATTAHVFIPKILSEIKIPRLQFVPPYKLARCVTVVCFNRLGSPENHHGVSESSDADIKVFLDPQCFAKALGQPSLLEPQKDIIKNHIKTKLSQFQEPFLKLTGLQMEIEDFTVQFKNDGLKHIINQTEEMKFISTLQEGWEVIYGKNLDKYLELIRNKKVNRHSEQNQFDQNLNLSLKKSFLTLENEPVFHGHKNIAFLPTSLELSKPGLVSDNTFALSLKYQCMRFYDYDKENTRAQLGNTLCSFLQEYRINDLHNQTVDSKLNSGVRRAIRAQLDSNPLSYEDITTDQLAESIQRFPAEYASLFIASCSAQTLILASTSMQGLCESLNLTNKQGSSETDQISALSVKISQMTRQTLDTLSYQYLRGIYEHSKDLHARFQRDLTPSN